MVQEILFYITLMLTNIMQGITGFAGTILAMPFALKLVGYEVAKPVLNGVGIVAGLYVVVDGRRNIDKKQLVKIVLVMTIGILSGICIRSMFIGKDQWLNIALGVFVVGVGLKGIIKTLLHRTSKESTADDKSKGNSILGYVLLVLAGIIHGIFVSGGPLLITYLTKEIKQKDRFRCTISACWVVLNSVILISDIIAGYYTMNTIRIQMIAIPFLFVGMFIGSSLVKRMSQPVFMTITYILLLIAGTSLLI